MDILGAISQSFSNLPNPWATWLAWAGGAVGFIVVMKLLASSGAKSINAWLALPTLEEYFGLHPECNTNSGPRCFKCHSNSIWSTSGNGLAGDKDRTIYCRHCNTVLYRIAGELTNPILRHLLSRDLGTKKYEDLKRFPIGKSKSDN